ncbi:MAG: hypothetical protein J5854_05555 [Clostridia bacterium]|nr:hypothetical protein [Clostridia bacterium]
MKKTTAIILILLMLLTPLGAGAQKRDQVGTDVSGFSSTDVNGGTINGSVFGSYRASVVCYFAMWSSRCLSQLELLDEVHTSHPEYGVFGLLLVDATSTAELAKAYLESKGYTFTVFLVDSVWQSVVDQSVFIPQSHIVSNAGVIVESWQATFSSADKIVERLDLYAADVQAPDGDVNADGSVDATDALIVLRMAMGIIPVTQDALRHGDMDGSGTLEAADALIILRMAMGIIV